MVDLPRRRETAGPVATAFLDRLRQGALRVLTTAPLPRTSLNGRVPDSPRGPIGENWPGDPKRGAAILAGDIEFCISSSANAATLAPQAGVMSLHFLFRS